ncbi:hypothetical protein VMCG_02525 [Cytospora schulzeri]|uniref:Uncharacterized protein n=1 Tax=Cytospora schulzeri TaxID=448051 RepID=A0A423X2H5_9PEZI|nr:hypothetical protein VMCG_02525 [Valsa malicola]
MDVDLEGFELLEHPELETPETIEILNSIETERTPATDTPRTLRETNPEPMEKALQIPVEEHKDEAIKYKVETPSADPPAPFQASSSVAEYETSEPSEGNNSSFLGNPPDNGRQHRCPSPGYTAELAYVNECRPYLSLENMDRIILMGRNSPGSRPAGSYAGPPLSYIPSDQPGGPRDLPSDCYNCPVAGCRLPSGPAREGYTRQSLALHIRLCHGGSKIMREVRRQIRERILAVRFERDQEIGPTVRIPTEADDPKIDLQRQTDNLIRDLDEIREWEHSRRFVVPNDVAFFSERRVRLAEIRQPPSGGDEVMQDDGVKEGQRSGSPTSRPRANRFARRKDDCSLHSREATRSPQNSDVAGSLTHQRLQEASRIKSPSSVGHWLPLTPSLSG